MPSLFPAKPSDIDASIANPGAAFKREVVKVFLLCLLFLLLYLLLLAAVVGIAVLFGFLGFFLIIELHNFVTVMFAAGAIIMGLMLIYFMIRSLILKKAEPIATVGEITQDSEPVFFEFIKKVCEETNAPFPRKIFLVEDVNAFVSYDSVFLSLFFPARKNLYIGLGLINVLTISELKAIIAHEFGHFSQRSMRFGSYVYHFNQIIYRMVEDNSGYNTSLRKIARVSNYFALFAVINLKIIKGIQALMAAFYKVLNKGYLGLSRQMEFHADAVAATAAGSAPLITALYRLELAITSYEQLLEYYNDLIKDNLRAENIYTQHFRLMQLMSVRQQVELKNGFPMITAATINRMGRNRVKVKDQWASHPSVEDREEALLRLNIASELVELPAWELFSDAPKLQRLHTERLYASIAFPSEPILLDESGFESKYNEFLRQKSYDEEYKGYYNDRNMASFDLNMENYLPEDLPLEALFADEYLEVPARVEQIESEITLLESISEKGAGYKTFDFDGKRHPIQEAIVIKDNLEKELLQLREKLKFHDQEIFYIARRRAESAGAAEILTSSFAEMFKQVGQAEKDLALYREMAEAVAPVYNQHRANEIELLVSNILQKEKALKTRMGVILETQKIRNIPSIEEDLELIRQLYTSEHVYFSKGEYVEEELRLLNHASNALVHVLSEYYFQVKKAALNIQLSFLKGETVNLEL